MISKKNKKGVSQIIGTVLLIAIAIGLIAGVWTIVNSFVSDRLDKTGDCYSTIGQLEFNRDYVCYNVSAGYILASISVGEIELDSILLSVQVAGNSDVYTLTNESKTINGILPYNSASSEVRMPGKESGKTYVISVSGTPELIQIAPRRGGTTCDVTDRIDNIATCA